MFPGPGAQVYTNEAGEPIGWDYPSDPEPMDDDDYERRFGARDAQAEEEYDYGYQQARQDAEDGEDYRPDPGDSDALGVTGAGSSDAWTQGYRSGWADNMAPILEKIHTSLQEMRHDLAADPPIDRKRGEE